MNTKQKRYDFPSVQYGNHSMDQLADIIAEHGGVYIDGLCMIRTIERTTMKPKMVDGIFKGGSQKYTGTHVLHSGSRNFSDRIKEKLNTRK